MKNALYLGFCINIPSNTSAQQLDSTQTPWSLHAQATYIVQHKNTFQVPYSGTHSLAPDAETQTSVTSTLFLARKLWKGGIAVFNPEIAAGSGLSSVYGLGSATNGETFRVGSVLPKLYVARMYIQQAWNLGSKSEWQAEDINSPAQKNSDKQLIITAGKISIADFFDQNSFSHDPRTQFINWALMSNGAYDYAANTRGYTPGVVLEYVGSKTEIRASYALLPIIANGNDMDWKSAALVSELTRRFGTENKPGAIRLLVFFNNANMGSYQSAIDAPLYDAPVDITQSRSYKHHKYGFALNAEKQFNETLGGFFRASWNDGHNETWAFTEIDKSLTAGLNQNGKSWRRPNDTFGVAGLISGLSPLHQKYLAAGGTDFMLGDGNLNYKPEQALESYYSFALKNPGITLTLDYQILKNPGYNSDRKGPVTVFSFRTHLSI